MSAMRLLAAILLILLAWPVPWTEAGLDPQLSSILENLRPDEEVSVIATLTDQVDLDRFRTSARNIRRMAAENRRQHRQELVSALRDKSAATQGPLKSFLQGRGARKIEPLWIFNGLEVTAGREVIEALAARPEVAEVRLNGTLRLPTYTISQAAAPEWNLSAIHAPELWSLGFTGQGVVVATLDSGVDVLHADLGSKWRGGANSWFDPYGSTTVPYDVADPRTGIGHGTAVMGIMVGGSAGGTAIGVAPDARWIAAKIFNDAGGAENLRVHQGFQWLLDPDGNPGTDDAPDVVNHSWGFEDVPGVCISEFRADVQTLRAAGIAMAFAAGNSGSLASTSVSPANYPESFAVGAVDQALAVPLFSARGPSACDGTVYPEVVAPGVHVRTADLTSGGVIPASYALVDGTSFSAPHVAGAMALLLSALPGQSVTALEAALRQTATDLGPAGPDNSYGSGLINTLAAYTYLKGPAPNISILPSASFFNFGTVPINGSLAQGFTITNVGSADLLLSAIAVTGPDAAEFALSNDLCSGRSLVPSAGCTFEVTFAPLTTGKKIAAVVVPSNDPDTPLTSIVLVGNELVRIGAFRRGEWFLDNGSGGWDPVGDTVYQNFGALADIPVTGDWDGDGKTEVGTYRRGMWFLDQNGNGAWDPGVDTVYQNFGAPDDIPVTGDWNGDGRTEVGTYRRGMWFLDNGNGVWDPGVDTVYQNFGAPDDIPVTGDWNGDGRTEVGAWRRGTWFLDNGNGRWDAGVDTIYQNFGAADDIPVTGNWH